MIAHQPRHMACRPVAYVTLCADRQIRHQGTFPTVKEACAAGPQDCCLGRHRVLSADVADLYGDPR